MGIRILLGVASMYMALVGLGLIFAPRAFGTGAVPVDASPELIAFLRLWGSPLLGIAVLDWLARDAEPSATRDAILLANAVGFGAIATLDVWGSLGEAREFTEVFAIVHLLFTAAFLWGWRKSRGGR
jgi:hypothetical protein